MEFVVSHGDDVVVEEVVFIHRFLQCFKYDTVKLPLVEAERAIVGSAVPQTHGHEPVEGQNTW